MRSILIMLLVIAGGYAAEVVITSSIQVGMNFANNRGGEIRDGYEQAATKPGLSGGIGVDVAVGKVFAVEPELLYSPKGHKWIENNLVFVNSLSYLELPVLFKINIPLFQTVPSLYAGPSFGWLLSAKEEIDGKEQEESNNWNSFDFGLTLGSGVKIPVNYGAILFDLRYTLGFSEVYKSGYVDYDENVNNGSLDIRNGTLSLLLGYEFGGK